VLVDISAVKELGGVAMTEEGLVVGATTTLSQLAAALLANGGLFLGGCCLYAVYIAWT
jgi:CO/xanthine dehydrogenase FAD-binding subunit